MFHVASSKQSVSKRTQEESNPLAALSLQGDNALWHNTIDQNINYNSKQLTNFSSGSTHCSSALFTTCTTIIIYTHSVYCKHNMHYQGSLSIWTQPMRDNVTLSLIGWEHTQNDTWSCTASNMANNDYCVYLLMKAFIATTSSWQTCVQGAHVVHICFIHDPYHTTSVIYAESVNRNHNTHYVQARTWWMMITVPTLSYTWLNVNSWVISFFPCQYHV